MTISHFKAPVPQTFDECGAEILRLAEQIAESKREFRRLSKELEDARFKAEQYDKICQHE